MRSDGNGAKRGLAAELIGLALGVLVAFCSWLIATKDPDLPPPIAWAQGQLIGFWWITPGLAVVAVLIPFYHAVRRRNAWVWPAVRVVLDCIARDAYPSLLRSNEAGAGIRADEVRVTLFRHDGGRLWVFGPRFRSVISRSGRQSAFSRGWLVAEERSGHVSRTCFSCWGAGAGRGTAEGIAGNAWSGGRIEAKDLVDPLSFASGSTAENNAIRAYAKATMTSEDEVRRRVQEGRHGGTWRGLSTYFFGCQVFVGGEIWGSLVVDAPRRPEGNVDGAISAYREVLSALLVRA